MGSANHPKKNNKARSAASISEDLSVSGSLQSQLFVIPIAPF